MSTWFMTQIIAFRDVTAKFYDMGLIGFVSETVRLVQLRRETDKVDKHRPISYDLSYPWR